MKGGEGVVESNLDDDDDDVVVVVVVVVVVDNHDDVDENGQLPLTG